MLRSARSCRWKVRGALAVGRPRSARSVQADRWMSTQQESDRSAEGDELAVPSWAIGYGVQVSPLFVARAYAGIATGALPTMMMRWISLIGTRCTLERTFATGTRGGFIAIDPTL